MEARRLATTPTVKRALHSRPFKGLLRLWHYYKTLKGLEAPGGPLKGLKAFKGFKGLLRAYILFPLANAAC